MNISVRDRMITRFIELDGKLHPNEALNRLGTELYGVVRDQDSQPISLIISRDIEQAILEGVPTLLDATLPLSMVVSIDITLFDLVESELIHALALDSRGAIILDADIVGVVPIEVIFDYLSNDYEPPSASMGNNDSSIVSSDSLLGGSIRLARIPVRCTICKYMNTLAFYDPERQQECQNPTGERHQLRIHKKVG